MQHTHCTICSTLTTRPVYAAHQLHCSQHTPSTLRSQNATSPSVPYAVHTPNRVLHHSTPHAACPLHHLYHTTAPRAAITLHQVQHTFCENCSTCTASYAAYRCTISRAHAATCAAHALHRMQPVCFPISSTPASPDSQTAAHPLHHWKHTLCTICSSSSAPYLAHPQHRTQHPCCPMCRTYTAPRALFAAHPLPYMQHTHSTQ
jgi:hypothetical protein